LAPEANPVRTIDWQDGAVVIVDQTALPADLRILRLETVDALVDAIARLAVRGAPALGAAGGLGVALAAVIADREGAPLDQAVPAEAEKVRAARPTAVNLAWGVDRVLARLDEGVDVVVAEAVAMLDEDVATNQRIGARGADLLADLHPGPVRLLTHCNTGSLACVDWGTALGVARTLHQRGLLGEVFANETRPLLQGARLTTWELREMGATHRLVVDSAGPTVVAQGMVDAVIVGADRIAANGDVVNKVGTYPQALAAARAGLPFIVAAPESTIDLNTATGADIHIEERGGDEVTRWGGVSSAPEGTATLNLAFDVTPADLVTAIVTEARVIRPALGERPSDPLPAASVASGTAG
jgi:S-methyl-5-thioribose-1-phosphate isomerase